MAYKTFWKDKNSYVYILANKRNGTIYVGVTNNLERRVYEHKNDAFEGFTKKYAVHTLVYFEHHTDITAAIWREKCIKRWNRKWKIELIEKENPEWKDLYHEIKSWDESGMDSLSSRE